ncbi:MAG TPA: helical backbone metal receptor [Tepidisphaeraceae bacterium]|nr:helical backbone metal receptor [Tepidisphaeraceae bacterium]
MGCGKESTAVNPTTVPAVKTVASLVPAVTDLIIGMGARDRLVAVSTYDRQRPDVASLPKVGDYQTVDWEQLQLIKPSILVIDIQADRRPAGFNERAESLHTQLVNITINRLSDVFAAIDQLGKALDLPQQATDAGRTLKTRLDAIEKRSADQNLPPVRTLLVVGESGQSVVGPHTYLDDLLKAAGGVNVAAHLDQYPQVDREMLISLKPDVIVQLMPDPSPQEREQAARAWRDLPQVPAVAAGRVYTIDSWYALLPGWHVADLAEQLAECLHPPTPSSSPTTGRGAP